MIWAAHENQSLRQAHFNEEQAAVRTAAFFGAFPSAQSLFETPEGRLTDVAGGGGVAREDIGRPQAQIP
jgi:hypothetical protein